MLITIWANVCNLPSSRVLVVFIKIVLLLCTNFHSYTVNGLSPVCSKGRCDTIPERGDLFPSSWKVNWYELNWQWWAGSWKVFKVVNRRTIQQFKSIKTNNNFIWRKRQIKWTTRQHFYRHVAPQVCICTNKCKWSNALHELHIEYLKKKNYLVLDTKLALMSFNCRYLYNAATWHKKSI